MVSGLTCTVLCASRLSLPEKAILSNVGHDCRCCNRNLSQGCKVLGTVTKRPKKLKLLGNWNPNVVATVVLKIMSFTSMK